MVEGFRCFHCPECGFGDEELGHLAADHELLYRAILPAASQAMQPGTSYDVPPTWRTVVWPPPGIRPPSST
jgi:rubredoxin